jgi:hypothetical protein
MPRNTETRILKLSREKIIHEHPEIKILFSWADGMRGKPGFVYQADNWHYGGFIVSEFYRDKAGEVVHPRQLITRYGRRDKAFVRRLGLVKYRGPQFRYIRFLCGHKERKRLLSESSFQWDQPYPKMVDIFLNAGEGSGVIRTATNGQGLVQFQDPAIPSEKNNTNLLRRIEPPSKTNPEQILKLKRKPGRPIVPVDMRILAAIIRLHKAGYPWSKIAHLLTPMSRRYGGPNSLCIQRVRRLARDAAKLFGVHLKRKRHRHSYYYRRQNTVAGGET